MTDSTHAREWEELRKIDYFLEHLARAVERGEVHSASYEILAPRYLERRAELAAVIERRSDREPVVRPTVSAGEPATIPVVAASSKPDSAFTPVVTDRTLPAAAAAPTPRREPRPVPWTTVLTITGAFLVIVAAAIFAVATWDLFGVGFKLVFLGSLTAAFYAAGHLVRTRLGLAAGGVALMAVGSAMLLFDGWIAIDGYGLEGPWPWIGWLAVCSLAYWFSEVAIGGSFFGVIGASAQVAWVWLLGEGLAWPAPQRLAGMALVAVLWALAARNAQGKAPFSSLALVLHWAAPALVIGCGIGLGLDISTGPATWMYVASALVVGSAATMVFEVSGLPSGLAALLHVSVFLGIVSMIDMTGTEWGHVILLALMVIGYLIHELRFGGWGHGIIALAAELLATLVFADLLGWEADATVALVGAVAVSWLVASRLLDRAPVGGPFSKGAAGMRSLAEAGGWLGLGASTLAVPFASGAVPLSAMAIHARDAALPAGMMGLWALGGAVKRREPVGVALIVVSLYATAAVLAWSLPELHSAVYAAALVSVLAIWFFARGLATRLWALPAEACLLAVRILSLLVLVVGLAAQSYFFDVIAWQSAVLIGLVALLWLFDALLAEDPPVGFGVASTLLVLAAALAGEWYLDSGDPIMWIGPATAVALALVSIPLRSRSGWATWWNGGAGVAAVLVILVSVGAPSQAIPLAFALTGLVWLIMAVASDHPLFVPVAGLFGFCAIFAAADHFVLGPWATLAPVTFVAYALLSLLFLPEARLARRWTDAAAAAGLIGMVLMCLAMAEGGLGAEFGLSLSWAGSGGHELAAAVGLLGVFVMVAGIARRIDAAPYLGGALVLLAYFIEIDTLDVGTVEWFSTPLALYIMWAGARVRKGMPGRGTAVPDVLAAAVGLGVPALLSTLPLYQDEPWVHLAWAVMLSIVAILAGVTFKVRGYFFGGVVALVFTAVVRSWFFLVSFWWLVLGIIGVTMLVVALTWERQQMLVADAERRLRAAMVDWR